MKFCVFVYFSNHSKSTVLGTKYMASKLIGIKNGCVWGLWLKQTADGTCQQKKNFIKGLTSVTLKEALWKMHIKGAHSKIGIYFCYKNWIFINQYFSIIKHLLESMKKDIYYNIKI